jgi:propanediol dehydratase small subunit
MVVLLIVVTILAVLVLGALLSNDIPLAYRQRRCTGKQWRSRFPNASKQDIRQFLWLFTSAFAIRRRNALLFGPDDELLIIYRARYPSRLTPDALEFEVLARDIQRVHQVNLDSIWHERLTLGELFDGLRGGDNLAHV